MRYMEYIMCIEEYEVFKKYVRGYRNILMYLVYDNEFKKWKLGYGSVDESIVRSSF